MPDICYIYKYFMYLHKIYMYARYIYIIDESCIDYLYESLTQLRKINLFLYEIINI